MTGPRRAVMGYMLMLLVVLLRVGLPIAVWLDLSDLVETNLHRQASDVNSIISSVRNYYANNVIGRVLASPGTTKVIHNYKDFPGAIPIPATLSLSLGKVISEQQQNIKFRFVSDYPFKNRALHPFDEFETDALGRLRQNSNQQLTRVSSSVFSDDVRLIAPVIMEQPCVNCHNSHGTIDKFIGDAMLVFFGDPETKGDVDDAKSCLRMAVEMQHQIAGLNAEWRNAGIHNPIRVRMGINTGFCNVGNFGSNDRMDYTIIGAEANLAARLQSIAEPGNIVVSYETYALVRDIVVARALTPITVKGISREVVPYAVPSALDASGKNIEVFSEHLAGLDLYFNAGMIDATDAKYVRNVLEDALKALSKQENE